MVPLCGRSRGEGDREEDAGLLPAAPPPPGFATPRRRSASGCATEALSILFSALSGPPFSSFEDVLFAASIGAFFMFRFNAFCNFGVKKCMLASTIDLNSCVEAKLGSSMTSCKLAAFSCPAATCMSASWNHSFRVSASMLRTCSDSVEISSSLGVSCFFFLGTSLREKV